MQPLKIFLWGLTLLVLSGCSAVQVSQDYDPGVDFAGSGGFAWRDPVQPATGDVRIDNPLLDRRIRQAVNNHLAARGFAATSNRADWLLVYHLTVESRIESDPGAPVFGMRRYHYPWYGGFDSETRVRQFDECRLTIDIQAADSNHLLWRGTGVYRLKIHKNPQAATDFIQKAVDRILSQFPPDKSAE